MLDLDAGRVGWPDGQCGRLARHRCAFGWQAFVEQRWAQFDRPVRNMVQVPALETWQWSADAFVRAWEAGVFGDARVELVEGEVWPVPIGMWHGAVTANVMKHLPNDDWRVTAASLPSGESVPDPDVWVHLRGAEPDGRLGSTGRIASWNPDDVALVVEVADTSLTADLDVKARVYGRAGYSTYWVVHRAGIDVLTDPYTAGYRRRISYGPGETVPVPYRPDVAIAVDAILDADS